MKTYLFRATCLTNMHVGSGDADYSIIDNRVERDPVIDYLPVIHASGVKGALKEHCEHCEKRLNKEAMTYIFGNSDGDKTNSGNFKFFGASVIARPLRVSKGGKSYILASTPEIITTYVNFLQGISYNRFSGVLGEMEQLTQTLGDKEFITAFSDVEEIEGAAARAPRGGEKLAATSKLFADRSFALARSLKDYDLPVLARNQLNENGISKNLWYEEIVPHQSLFYFAVMAPDGEKSDNDNFESFRKAMTENPVQFGGNASIGYGFTKIEEVRDEQA